MASQQSVYLFLKMAKKEIIQKAKGMRDILTMEYLRRQKIIERAQTIASFYGFKPVQTPHLEKTELFTAAVGENTDIVEKEMYELKTKGGDKLALRPELTAPLVRAYLEYGMHTAPQPVMFYSYGSCFRHERPQKGRSREFQQFDLEILGEENSIADATVIKTLLAILEEAANLKNLSIRINSIGCKECRPVYKKELIAYYRKKINSLCPTCRKRLKTNPMRLLDCKNEKCVELKQEAPQIINHLCKECTAHFKNLLETLDAAEIPYYLDHYLVRGLDYYTRTVFEINTENEPLEIGGGGRYDDLAKLLGDKSVPGTGAAFGLDRVLSIMPNKEKISENQKPPKVFLIQLGEDARRKSLLIIETLRKAKISIGHSLNKDSLKSQLKIANKIKAPYTLILGQKEFLENTILLRDMNTASQETIPLPKLADFLKKKIK